MPIVVCPFRDIGRRGRGDLHIDFRVACSEGVVPTSRPGLNETGVWEVLFDYCVLDGCGAIGRRGSMFEVGDSDQAEDYAEGDDESNERE